jgi:biopolymer transport protein ExbD
MAMNVGSGGEGEPMMDVNTTPLIDVMLVLIVMMIITIPVQTHATKLDMPQSTPNEPNKPPPQVINLVIDSDNSVYWDGTPVTMIELEQHFRPYSNVPLESQPELHIRPDKWTKYDMVAQVLAAAQRNRMEKIGFVGNEQYM